jgi:hypothetical protein
MNRLMTRISKLECQAPAETGKGAVRFIWRGPEDDAAMEAARLAAEANGQMLIQRVIVGPPSISSPRRLVSHL